MMMPRVPSALGAMLVIIAVTLRRVLRGRAVWVSAAIAMLPIGYAILARKSLDGRASFLPSEFLPSAYNHLERVANNLLAFEILLLVVLPPMFIASSIGEEIEDRTTTYLWSRALPRWTILAGKLVALSPLPIALVLASWCIAAMVVGTPLTLASALSLVACGIAIACVTAGITTLVPKHGLALTMTYFLFFDLPTGFLPVSLRYLSITHHARTIGGLIQTHEADSFTDSLPGSATLATRVIDNPTTASIALTVIASVWASVAFLRIRRLEV